MKIISVQSMVEGVDLSSVATAIAIEHQKLGSRVVAIDTNFGRRTLTNLINAGFYHIGDVRRLVQYSCDDTHADLSLMPKLAVWGYHEASQEIRLGNGQLAVRAGISEMISELDYIRLNFYWLKRHFDVLVIDVLAGDHRQMDAITCLSHEIHVVVRDKVRGLMLKDWRTRFANGNTRRSPKVFALSEDGSSVVAVPTGEQRDNVPSDKPSQATIGQSSTAEVPQKNEKVSSRCVKDRKRFELTVDRVLGDRIRSVPPPPRQCGQRSQTSNGPTTMVRKQVMVYVKQGQWSPGLEKKATIWIGIVLAPPTRGPVDRRCPAPRGMGLGSKVIVGNCHAAGSLGAPTPAMPTLRSCKAQANLSDEK